jgi:integration host factor subunit beta
MTDALCYGDRVELRGFGSFEVRQRKPRLGRNPRSGESYPIPARKGVYFRLSPLLRDALNAED